MLGSISQPDDKSLLPCPAYPGAFVPVAVYLAYRCPLVYSPQRGTVGGTPNLADGDPDADAIELLEIQDWSGDPLGSGVGFRQESGTLNTGSALTFPVIL